MRDGIVVDVAAIVNNLCSTQSEELMRKHMEDPEFEDTFGLFVVLRQLSCSGHFEEILDAQTRLEYLDDPKLAYQILFKICKRKGPTIKLPLIKQVFKR